MIRIYRLVMFSCCVFLLIQSTCLYLFLLFTILLFLWLLDVFLSGMLLLNFFFFYLWLIFMLNWPCIGRIWIRIQLIFGFKLCCFLWWLYFWLFMKLHWLNSCWVGTICLYLMSLLRYRYMLLGTNCYWSSSSCDTPFLYSIKNSRYDGLRIESMYFFNHVPLLIMYSCIRKRAWSNMLWAKLRIPLTIKIINLKTPFFFMLKLIECSFEISTVRAMWGEIFNKFEWMLVLEYFWIELCITDKIGIRHIPLITER
jgi:hypothetical protein